jgi:hypothetical protein
MVKYVDLSESEEKLIATTFFDPIAEMTEFDSETLEGLKIGMAEMFDVDLRNVFRALDSVLGVL